MGRRKITKPKGAVFCAHCDKTILPNAPLDGMIYEWNGKVEGICCDCGTTVARLFKIINQRWG